MELTNRMSDKIGWNEKVFDKDITTKWKSEALATPDTDISEKMVDWVGTSCISPSDSAYYPHLTAGSVSPSLNIKQDYSKTQIALKCSMVSSNLTRSCQTS